MSTKTVQPPVNQDLAISDKASEYGKQYIASLIPPEDTIILTKGSGQYTIYREVLRDEQVRSCFQQRRLALIHKKWEIFPGEEDNAQAQAAADALTLNLQNIPWDHIADKMLYGLHFGYSVGRLLWNEFGDQSWAKDLWGFHDVKVHDLKNYGFGGKGELFLVNKKHPKGLLLQTYHDVRSINGNAPGEDKAPSEFWVFNVGGDNDDDPYGTGLAYSLYWHVFYKRQDLRFWLRFLEKFATPTHQAKADNAHIEDPKHREKILAVMASMLGDSGVIVPDWLEVTLLESTRTGAVEFDALREAADRAIAKVIVGQTMTTEQEGGQFKADTAKDIRDEIVAADADLLSSAFNASVASWFSFVNFGPDVPPPRLHWIVEPEEDKTERAERDNKIKTLGFTPTLEYIVKTYGEGWEVSATPAPLAQPSPQPADPTTAFAEDLTDQQVLDAMSGHLGDQARIKGSSALMGHTFRKVLGPRVDELLAYAEESGDLATFRKHLTVMMADQPLPAAVEQLRDTGFASRLAGLFRKSR